MARAKLTPGEIMKAVERADQSTLDLRKRMEDDYNDRWILKPFKVKAGYQSFTTNESRAMANKVISLIVDGKLNVSAPMGRAQQEERERHSAQERFLRGVFRAVDEELENQFMPSLRAQLTFYATVRGFCFGRALLSKNEDGDTFVDVVPWDPMHTYWSVGRRGMIWMAYRVNKTVADIKAEYPEYKFEADEDDTAEHQVTDWYDDRQNAVIIHHGEGAFLKAPAEHGSQRVPCFFVAQGSAPPVQAMGGATSDKVSGAASDYGESIWATNRHKYNSFNETMSDAKHLIRRAKRPTYVVVSRDGTRVLETDPFADGTEIALKEGERIEVLDWIKMPPDTPAFIAIEAGEMQRGGLPYIAYGELPFAISGFGMVQLRQGIGSVVGPPKDCVTHALAQIARHIAEQYASGKFKKFKLHGRDSANRWFEEEFDTELMKDTRIEVTLMPDLPQDRAAAVSMAQMARDPGASGVPMLPDRMIHEQYLNVEDPDLVANTIKEQQAERMSPLAVMNGLALAAGEMGRGDLVKIYLTELQRLVASMFGPQTPPSGAVPQEVPPLMPPTVLPNSVAGEPPPMPIPQAGPNVPPGSPRPGAQGGNGRL